jgi:hypothetical protein
MSRKKLIFLILISILVIAIIVAFVFIRSNTAANNRILAEKTSIAAHKNLMQSFTSPNGTIEYHANFGGAYINNRGYLVLMIAPDDNAQILSDLSHSRENNLLSPEITVGSATFRRQSSEILQSAFNLIALTGSESILGLRFQKALYPFSYLTDLMNHFNDEYFNNYSNPNSIWYHITGFTLHDNLNNISVEILNLDETKIERFRSDVSRSQAIVLISSRAQAAAESLHAGMRANTGSIGFRARMGDKLGFVTAGHNVSTGMSVHRWGKIGIGIISIVDSTLDGAFVRTDNVIGEIYNTTHTGRVISGINTNPLIGSTVFKEGRATGLTVGTLISANATHRYTLHNGHVEVRRKNLIIADYISAANDSGGIIYDINGHVFGIHIAGPAHGLAGERLIEKVSTIQNVLGVSFY